MSKLRTIIIIGAAAALAWAPTFARGPRDDDPARELAASIDTMLDDAAVAEKIAPSPPLDDLAFLRRLELDVLGTTPSLDEIRALESDPADGRRERAVARVLADPRANDQLAERLARIAVGTQFKANTLEDLLFYRRRRLVAWLADQLAAGKGWDELVRALVASEGVVTDTPAVNFVCAQDGDPIKLAGRSARAFLGVRIDCAQCHDHPFASWKQRDFDGLAAFFGRVHRRGPFVRDLAEGGLTVEDTHGKRTPAPDVPFAKEALPVDARTFRDAYARWITDRRNPYFARAFVNRAWSWFMGHGFVEPVDELDQSEPEKPLAPVLDLLARDFADHGFDIRRLERAIVSTRAYARSSVPTNEATVARARALHATASWKPLHADQLASALYQATNAWTYDGERSFLVRLQRFGETNELVKRHGEDLDAERPESPTLLRRLLLMNGKLVEKRVTEDQPGSVARAASLLPDDGALLEVLYLMALSRRPTAAEVAHFAPRLSGAKEEKARRREAADIAWALVNSTEFSWNH